MIPLLADRYHVVAPDYPGFGRSDAPPAEKFRYTFDHLAEVIGAFTEALRLTSYVLHLDDYGGPVGFRLALAQPERVEAFVIQNAVAHEEGLGPAWEVRKAFWKDRAALEDGHPGFVSLEGCKARHVGSSPRPERYDPDTWSDEYALLSRPGAATNPVRSLLRLPNQRRLHPKWQAWMREHKPPMLVVWGRYDPSFTVGGPTPTSVMCLTRKCISWMPAISRWTKGSTRSPHSCGISSRRTIFLRRRDAMSPVSPTRF